MPCTDQDTKGRQTFFSHFSKAETNTQANGSLVSKVHTCMRSCNDKTHQKQYNKMSVSVNRPMHKVQVKNGVKSS